MSRPTLFYAQRYVPFIRNEPAKQVLRLNARGQAVDSVASFSPLNTSVQYGTRVDDKEVYFHPRLHRSQPQM